jgi:formylglycine-generating enzyme required for sulfatase activity
MGNPIKITAAATLTMAALLAYLALTSATRITYTTELVTIKAGEFTYYPAGQYLHDNFPVNPPAVRVRFTDDFLIMKRQVSQAEYAACVSDGGCKAPDRAQRRAASPDLPATGISWVDATAYAQWLSNRTGYRYSLPSYAQWVYAAGSAYKEDELIKASDPNDPAQRWLAEYELEARRKTTGDVRVKTFGGYGVSSTGLLDAGGNVWEWTNTCSSRQWLDENSVALSAPETNCGIRVVAGRHRGYIADFIRDPRGGACSVGIPPTNLGFRLIRRSAA